MTAKYIIKHAGINDLEKLAELESLCFPAAEAASAEAFLERLKVYPKHFWLLESDGQMVLMNQVIADTKANGRNGIVLTCKKKLIPYYEKFGFVNEGISGSEHGNVVWYQMRKTF